MLEQPATYLVDVRTIAEYVFVGHPEMAYNIPLLFWKEMEQKSAPNENFMEDIDSRFKNNPFFLHLVQTAVENLFFQLKIGYAVSQQSADPVRLFEHNDFMASAN